MFTGGPGGDDFNPSNKTQLHTHYLVTAFQSFGRGTTISLKQSIDLDQGRV